MRIIGSHDQKNNILGIIEYEINYIFSSNFSNVIVNSL